MNEENVSYLQNQLKFMGFGDKLSEKLVEQIQTGKQEFSLKANYEYKRPPTAPNEINEKDTVSYELHFRKGSEKDMYFFNKYDASLVKDVTQKEVMANGAEIVELKNTFYLNNGKGITAKEAYNLLDGRSVYKELNNKEGETYNAWLKIKFDVIDDKGNHKLAVFTDKYGFDVAKELSKLQSMEQPYKEKIDDILQSLKKGNVTPISIDKKEEGILKFSLQANPEFHAIDVFDASGKKQFIERRNGQAQEAKLETADLKPEKKPEMAVKEGSKKKEQLTKTNTQTQAEKSRARMKR